MWLDPEGQALDPAGRSEGIVGHGQQPDPRASLAHKSVQTPRPVGRPTEKVLAAPAVVIDQVEKTVGPVVETVVVVQDGELFLVTQVADQVAYRLVRDVIGHDHAADRQGLGADGEHQRATRRIRRAVRYFNPRRQAAYDATAIVACFIEGDVGRKADDAKLRSLLVFRFHAEIENLIQAPQSVGENHQFRATPIQRLGRAGDGRRVQVEQRRVAGNIKINVRVQIARARQVGRQKGDKGDVAAVGQAGEVVGEKLIGKNIEAPLTDLAVGGRGQLEIRARPLF